MGSMRSRCCCHVFSVAHETGRGDAKHFSEVTDEMRLVMKAEQRRHIGRTHAACEHRLGMVHLAMDQISMGRHAAGTLEALNKIIWMQIKL